MSMFYQFIELFATFVEGAVTLFVISSLSTTKLRAKKYIAWLSVSALIYTALIAVMNNWQTFSFITVFLAILYTFIAVCVVSDSSFLLKATSTVLTWFFVQGFEYILVYTIVMIIGGSFDLSKGLELILYPGTVRTVFLLADKLIQISIFVSLYKLYSKIRLLAKKQLMFVLTITSFAYIMMSVLTSLILSDSIFILQFTVVLSLLFIIIAIISAILTVAFNTVYQQSKRDMELMGLSNEMMKKNYNEMRASQSIIRQQVHDFKNHLLTVYGMLTQENSAREYVGSLLEEAYNAASFCQCGNDTIDSIINCKIADAVSKSIQLDYYITIAPDLEIAPIDLCSVIANQIDNAIEACERITDGSERKIKVEIWQKEFFTFFKVTNSCADDPFDDRHELTSSKDASNSIHGFGTKIIQETAERYGGACKNDYSNNVFTSVVMIPLTGNS